MTIKILFNYKNLDQKRRQIKLLQTLFDLSLKEAKYAVDCGELILQECDENLVETIRSNSDANIEVVILSSQETEKTFQLTVYSHLQNLFPQECILLNKKEYEKERKELMKYKSLYLDLVGSIYSIMNTFPKE
ncbi:hypothetical protein [uncultured phage cr1_1]|uniref:Uncharacterized protein n=1 Tax=uncultured phage cr1_1 TaxID=2772064 RepID=A0A7M1RVY7_9CAUD|nr:hypothetical protein KNV31_gp047 [uncultured phage cr1_1]QOR58498.1 hypothetical protein [uncultured phage cr1_1]